MNIIDRLNLNMISKNLKGTIHRPAWNNDVDSWLWKSPKDSIEEIKTYFKDIGHIDDYYIGL